MKGKKLLGALTFSLSALAAAAGSGAHWSYHGHGGPSHWGSLDPDYTQCEQGREQSPIDISAATPNNLPAIDFRYGMSKINLVNNGHTIQMNYEAGSSIKINNQEFQLLQFHFHTPSEEKIGGKAYDLVAHLVHKNAEGKLAVVAVLFTKGRENPVLADLWRRLPAEEGETRDFKNITLSAAAMLPLNKGYYTYMGSLTTPPCTEGVRWIVLKNPVEMSPAQIARFKQFYSMNARPVQPLNGRTVLE